MEQKHKQELFRRRAEEVFSVTDNKKHLLCFKLQAYLGLRISEAVRVNINDARTDFQQILDPKRKYGREPILRAWKNIRFEILGKLSEKGWISDSERSKSIYLTNEGVKKAEELKNRFFGDKDE